MRMVFAFLGCLSTLLLAMPLRAVPNSGISPLTLPKLVISGQTAFNTWFYNNERKTVAGNATDSGNLRTGYGGGPLFTMDDSRLRFTVDGKTDPGMRYGIIFVLDGSTAATKTLREAYIFLEGSWGQLFLGDTYGVPSTMAFGGWDQWCGTKFLDGNFDNVVNYTTGTFNSVNLEGDTNRDSKVTYLTPRWQGFQLGVTYTPRTEHRGNDKVNAITSTVSPKKPFDVNNIASGVNFIHKFVNDIELALSATSIFAKTKAEYVGAPQRQSTGSFAIGGTVSYADVGFSMEYGDNGKTHQLAGQNYSNAGRFVDFGLSYKWGATKFSLGYYYSWRDALGGGITSNFTKVKASTNAVDFAMDHKLAPGMIVYFEYANFLMKNPAAADEANRINTLLAPNQFTGVTPNNRNNTFIVGSRLVF